MSDAIVTNGATRRADPDLAHVLAVQEHEVLGLARDAPIHVRAARAATGTQWVAADNSCKQTHTRMYTQGMKKMFYLTTHLTHFI